MTDQPVKATIESLKTARMLDIALAQAILNSSCRLLDEHDPGSTRVEEKSASIRSRTTMYSNLHSSCGRRSNTHQQMSPCNVEITL